MEVGDAIRSIREAGWDIQPSGPTAWLVQVSPDARPVPPVVRAILKTHRDELVLRLRVEVQTALRAAVGRVDAMLGDLAVIHTPDVRFRERAMEDAAAAYLAGSKSRQDAFQAIQDLEGAWMRAAAQARREWAQTRRDGP